MNKNYKKLKAKKSNNVIFSPMPLENEGNPEGLQLLRESLRKVQLESPDKVHLFICRGTETFITRFIHNRQTWNLSKILHRWIFRLKILQGQFHLIVTVLIRKTTKNE